MDAEADKLREIEYVQNVTHEMRQEEGILYPLAGSTKTYSSSEAKIEDRFGRMRMQPKNVRNGDTNYTDSGLTRRFIKKPGSYNVATLIDRDDQRTTSVDMKSPLVMETASAARTYHDDRFLLGWWGDAYEGKETSESTIAFPAANKIRHDLDGTSKGITKPKLVELKNRLRTANVNFRKERPIILLDADGESDMFEIEEYVNYDYNSDKPLIDGELKPWLGFRFLPANLGDPNAYPDSAALFNVGGFNRLPVIVPSGIHRGVWCEFWGKVAQNMNKQYSEDIFAEAESAVVRTDEKKAWFIETKPRQH